MSENWTDVTRKSGNGNGHRGVETSYAEFKSMWEDPSLRLKDIAYKLGITIQAVRSRAATRGLPSRRRYRTACGRLALDPEFKELWEQGVSRTEIMKYYGVTSNVLTRACALAGLPARSVSRFDGKTVMEAKLQKALRESAKATDEVWGHGSRVKRMKDNRWG